MVRKVAIWSGSGSLLKENEQKKTNICSCALFAFMVQVLLTNMSQKFTYFVWKIVARQSLPSKNFGLFGFWNTHKTILRQRILYFGERTSDNHLSYLDYHVSSRLRQLCIYLCNIPHENPSSFSRSTFSALPCLGKKQVLSLPLLFGWLFISTHFFEVCFPAYNPYVTTILNDN